MPLSGVIFDASRYLYGTTAFGPSVRRRVLRIFYRPFGVRLGRISSIPSLGSSIHGPSHVED